MKSALEIGFAGHMLVLDGSGALYWPQERILVVSDLHFEKATFLAQHGSFIAPYDTLDTLERLDALITQYQPRELVLLGDSFHDRHAWARLNEDLRARLAAIMVRVERCRWIEGNHDIALTAHGLPGFESWHERHGLLFSHEYMESLTPQIIGHYHPKIRIWLGGKSIKGPCFIHSDHLFIMPAFGSFTGGLDVQTPVLKALFEISAPAQAYLLYQKMIYKIPAAYNGK